VWHNAWFVISSVDVFFAGYIWSCSHLAVSSDANEVFRSKTGLQKMSQSLQSQALPSQSASLDINFSQPVVTSPVAIKRAQKVWKSKIIFYSCLKCVTLAGLLQENVCSAFQAADLAGVARETSIFEDCVFCA
jgi:hypothetical protein